MIDPIIPNSILYPPQTKYINLGVIRPFSSYLGKIIQKSAEKISSLSIPVCTDRTKSTLTLNLQRLLNNNEPEYFFLPAEPSLSFPNDSCVFLKLSIAIKVDHYDKCLNARILQLDDPFQHKLGWLVGQMYSRVGTQDWDRKSMNLLIKQYLDTSALWIDDKVKKDLISHIESWTTNNPGLQMDDKILTELIRKIPNKKNKVIERIRTVFNGDRIINHLKSSGIVTTDQIDKIIKSIESYDLFTHYLN